jgi:hypothetical protein
MTHIFKLLGAKLKTFYLNRIKPIRIAGIAVIEFSAIIGIIVPATTGIFDVGVQTFMHSQMQYAADYGARNGMTGFNQASSGSAGSVAPLQSNITNLMPFNGSGVTSSIQSYPAFANAMYASPPAPPVVPAQGSTSGCWNPNNGTLSGTGTPTNLQNIGACGDTSQSGQLACTNGAWCGGPGLPACGTSTGTNYSGCTVSSNNYVQGYCSVANAGTTTIAGGVPPCPSSNGTISGIQAMCAAAWWNSDFESWPPAGAIIAVAGTGNGNYNCGSTSYSCGFQASYNTCSGAACFSCYDDTGDTPSTHASCSAGKPSYLLCADNSSCGGNNIGGLCGKDLDGSGASTPMDCPSGGGYCVIDASFCDSSTIPNCAKMPACPTGTASLGGGSASGPPASKMCTNTPPASGFSSSSGSLQSGSSGAGLQSQAAVYQLTYTYNPITPMLSPTTITVYSAALNNPTF